MRAERYLAVLRKRGVIFVLKDVTLGQFFPGNSLLHRADPRSKLILTVLYIITLFIASNIISFAILLFFSLLMILISNISVRVILKGFKPVIFILMFTFLINVFFTKGETVLFNAGFLTVYAEGLYKAFIMSLRILMLINVTCLLMSYTTSPIMLTDAIEQLFAPLKRIKVPVHEFAMMMTIALRFIPTLIEETDKIMNAQKTRGADFSEGGLIKKAKALIPVLVPLFVSSFRRADELAVAMECRCYRGGEGRTRMTTLHYTRTDLALATMFVVITASVIVANIYLPIMSF